MKRLIRYVLIGAALLVAVIVAVLLIFREDMAQMALRSTLEFAEERVVQNLPDSETVEGVRKDFDALISRLEAGTVTSADLKPLLDTFASAYDDQQLTREEVKQILGEIRELLRR